MLRLLHEATMKLPRFSFNLIFITFGILIFMDISHSGMLPGSSLTEGFLNDAKGKTVNLELNLAPPSSTKSNSETTECVICLEKLTSKTKNWTLHHCGHRFHRGCVGQWFGIKCHCPICKTEYPDLESSICLICEESIDIEEPWKFRTLKRCNHTFHRNCVDKLLQKKGRCPICQIRRSEERRVGKECQP